MRRSVVSTLWLCAAFAAEVIGARAASAMQFDVEPLEDNRVVIAARGPIVRGDTIRLSQTVAKIPQGRRVIALALDSPGGSVLEGAQLADLIRLSELPVFIGPSSKCASACFLLLAASPRKYAANDALVGVHSASEGGEDTFGAEAITTQMARLAASYGVPPAIIGKMVQTEPDRVEWLTHADLASMGVRILGESDETAADPPDAPTLPRAAAPPPPTDGASHAPDAATLKGAYFCSTGPVALNISVGAGDEARPTRAIVTLGPMPTNPSIEASSYIAEVRLKPNFELKPIAWLKQPTSGEMVALTGTSSDGGAVFVGHANAGSSCSLFELSRVTQAQSEQISHNN
jgi:hypothetical protein